MSADQPPRAAPPSTGAARDAESPAELIEGVDYTLESETGFLIFTRDYLLKRGFCCDNGCLNCPYGFRRKSDIP